MIPSHLWRIQNLVLLALGLAMIADGWVARPGSDPGPGAFMVGLILLPRAVAMGAQSTAVAVVASVISAIVFAANANLLPHGPWRVILLVLAVALAFAVVFWDRLVSRVQGTGRRALLR